MRYEAPVSAPEDRTETADERDEGRAVDQSEPQPAHLSPDEQNEAAGRRRLRVPIIYEIIRQEGETELVRPISSLWWSGIAAGMAISTSLVARGVLHEHLADTEYRPLITAFGYTIGFLIVIMGRLQLFTENTITAVLPLLARASIGNIGRTARLWSVVLSANHVGTFLTAVMIVHIGIVPDAYMPGLFEVSRHFAELTAGEALLYGIPAGFLVAAAVWMMPSAEGSQFWVIIVLTYVIGIGGFAHVIVGSIEVFMLQLSGEVSLLDGFGRLILPTLVGNVIGGTGLFALLAYGQVQDEI